MQPAFLPYRAPRRRRLLRSLMGLVVLGFLFANGLIWIQARAMTHFVPHGQPLRQFATAPLPDKIWTLLTGVQLPRPENHHTPADLDLPFETRSIALPKNEQLEAWFVPHPQSRGVVLMFHGYAGVKDALLTPAATLYHVGYSSLLVDFRGSGGSSGTTTTLGLREADDVSASVAYAEQHWPEQPIIVYGISMGGAAILRAVALGGVRPEAIVIEGVFDRFLTTIQHRFEAVQLPSWPLAPMLVFWGSMQMGYNGFQHNPADYARSVTCPILVMRGERDPWIMSGETYALVDRIDAPKHVVEFPGVGHDMPYVYQAPDVWAATIYQFLTTLE